MGANRLESVGVELDDARVENRGVAHDSVPIMTADGVAIGMHSVDVDLLRPRLGFLTGCLLALQLVLRVKDSDKGVSVIGDLDRNIRDLVEARAVETGPSS